MRRVLATLVVGDYARKLHAVTHDRMKAYAESIGASYWVIRDTHRQPPHFAKFDLLTLAADDHVDELLYVDADVYIREQAPDIFTRYTSAAFNEIPHPHPAWVDVSIKWIRNHMAPTWPNDRYFNTGVLVITGQELRDLAVVLRTVEHVPGVYFEQDQLNVLLYEMGFPDQQLDQRWNQFCSKEWITPEKAAAAYFLHGNGVGQAEKLPLLERFAREYP